MIALLSLLITGVLAGTFGSLLGLGGGVIVVPVLTLFMGVPIHTAVGTSLLAVIATSSGAAVTYLRKHIADLRLGLTLELSTTLGGVAGGLASSFLGPDILRTIFGFFLLYIVWSMGRRKGQVRDTLPGFPRGSAARPVNVLRVKNLHLGLSMSFFAGILSGLLGVGGGIIKIPAMYLMMRLPLKIATATSAYMIGITALASSVIYDTRGHIDSLITAPVVLGVFAGSFLGSRLAGRVSPVHLRRIFIIVLIVFSIQMVAQGLRGSG